MEYEHGHGVVQLCFADCGRYEGWHLHPKNGHTWEQFTQELRCTYAGQLLTNSFYMFPTDVVPYGLAYTKEEQDKKFKEMLAAGWIHLGNFPGNHTKDYFHSKGLQPYWVALMGLILKPDLAKELKALGCPISGEA